MAAEMLEIIEKEMDSTVAEHVGNWQRLSPFETLVRTILSQNTTDKTSFVAFDNLKEKFQEIIEYTWTPLVQDDGTCLLYFQAYDSKENVGKSTTLLLIIRTGEMMTNIMLFTITITLLGLYIGNIIAKRVLVNDKIMRYIEDVQNYIRKPSIKEIRKVNPLFLFKKEWVSLSRINEINELYPE